MQDEMTPDQQLEQIQISREQAEKSVALWKAFTNLRNNEDFKTLIQDAYFRDEAARLVLLKADQSFVSDDRQKALDNAMQGISALNQFFNSIIQLGIMSQQSLQELENAEEEILVEDTEEEGVH